jgi:hypothetical protein
VVDHRGERRRLPRAGRPGEQDDPARLLGEPADDLREAEVVDGADGERNGAQRDRDGAALHVGVDSESGDAGKLIREVDLAVLLELGQVLLVGDLVEGLLGLLARQRVRVLERPEIAVDPGHGRRVHLHVEVRSLALNHV